MAYTVGLIPFVLIRSVAAPFLARGDTLTPMKAALIGTAVNIICKILLMGALAQVGLALATSIGAWINFILVLWLAARAGHFAIDAALKSSLLQIFAAGAVLAIVLAFAAPAIATMTSSWPKFRNESELLILALIGLLVYGGLVLALFGRRWLSVTRERAHSSAGASPGEFEGTSAPPAGPDAVSQRLNCSAYDANRSCIAAASW